MLLQPLQSVDTWLHIWIHCFVFVCGASSCVARICSCIIMGTQLRVLCFITAVGGFEWECRVCGVWCVCVKCWWWWVGRGVTSTRDRLLLVVLSQLETANASGEQRISSDYRRTESDWRRMGWGTKPETNLGHEQSEYQYVHWSLNAADIDHVHPHCIDQNFSLQSGCVQVLCAVSFDIFHFLSYANSAITGTPYNMLHSIQYK